PPLFPDLIVEAGERLRLQCRIHDVGPRCDVRDAGDDAVIELEPNGAPVFRMERIVERVQVEVDRGAARITSHLAAAVDLVDLPIAEPPEALEEARPGELDAGIEREGVAVDPRGHRPGATLELRGDRLLESAVAADPDHERGDRE